MTLDELKQRKQEEQRRLRELDEKIRQKEKVERLARWQALGKVVEEVLGVSTPDSLRAALSGAYRNGATPSRERPISTAADMVLDVCSRAVSAGSEQPELDHAGAATLQEESQPTSRGIWGRKKEGV